MCSDVRRWPRTKQVWRQFEQLDLVMKRTQVDPVLAARRGVGTAIAQARKVCLGCVDQRRCRALLEHGEPDTIMAFCPNAGFFEQCRRRELRKIRNTIHDI